MLNFVLMSYSCVDLKPPVNGNGVKLRGEGKRQIEMRDSDVDEEVEGLCRSET